MSKSSLQTGATPRVVNFMVDFNGKSGKFPMNLQFSVDVPEW